MNLAEWLNKEALGIMGITAIAVCAIFKATDSYLITAAIAGIAGISGFQLFTQLKAPSQPPK